MMDFPLTNQGPHKFTFRIGAKRAKNPADQISVHYSLDQSYEGLEGHCDPETGFYAVGAPVP